MEWILGVLSLVGVLMGGYTFLKIHKGYGAAASLLAGLCPLLTAAFCSLKRGRAYGGTNFEFLVHSAMVDKDPVPWILLLFWGIELFFILKTIRTMLK